MHRINPITKTKPALADTTDNKSDLTAWAALVHIADPNYWRNFVSSVITNKLFS